MEIGIKDLAEALGYTICGEESLQVQGMRFAHEATETDIAIAMSVNDIRTTLSKVVLTIPRIVMSEKTLILGDGDIYTSAIRTVRYMISKHMVPDYSIPPKYTMRDNVYYGNNVCVGKGTVCEPMTFIGDDVIIGKNCYIDSQVKICSGTVIGDDVCISFGSHIGADSFYNTSDEGNILSFGGIGKVRIGNHVRIGSHTVIQRGTFSDTVIGDGCIIGNLIDIGHDVKIGRNCRIVSQSGIAGNAVLEDCVKLFGQSAVSNYVHIGKNAVIYGKSAASRNVASNSSVFGIYGRKADEAIKTEAKIRSFIKGRK